MQRAQTFIVVVLTLVMSLVGSMSFAQEAGDMAAGLRVSYNYYQNDSLTFSGFALTADTEYDNVVGVSADFTYFISKSFSLELAAGYLQTDMSLENSGLKVNYGTLTQIPILLTGRYNFNIGEKIMPYIGLGVGYYLNDMENADSPGEFFNGAPAGVESFADDAFGYHVNTGVEYFVSEKIALNLDLKYTLLKTDIGFTGAGFDEKGSSNIDTFVAGVGAKYYF